MSDNPLKRLRTLGQSVWLDYIERDLLANGGLTEMIERDGLAGVTSNPSIFKQAIADTQQYDDAIGRLVASGADTQQIYYGLVFDDIRNAADLLRPVYDGTGGVDGYVSLEVAPALAHDTAQTLEQARWLWGQVDRPNLMIKVPGTAAGLPAIEQLIAEGINVNVTLLFGVPRYGEVLDAYIAGLQQRVRKGLAVDNVGSVASFFLSRIDSLVDGQVSDELAGKAAIASARLAYQHYRRVTGSERWTRLAELGARPQRLLWASTSTKNPAYSDVLYVEALIGSNTVNTMPPQTLDAYRDHGDPAPRLDADPESAAALMARLAEEGLAMEEVTARLETEGVKKFVDSFDELMEALERQRQQAASA